MSDNQEETLVPAPTCHCGRILTDRSLQIVAQVGWVLLGQCVDHGPRAMQWDGDGKKWDPIDVAFGNEDGPWSGAPS